MSDYLLHLWLTATWQAFALAVIVSIVVFSLRERLQPRWRYLLWCVVLLRLALPVLPETPWGIWNDNHSTTVSETVAVTQPPEPQDAPIFMPEWQPDPIPSFDPADFPVVAENTTMPSVVDTVIPAGPTFCQRLKTGFLVLWISGLVFLLIKCFWNEYQFYRQCRFWVDADDPTLLDLFESCRREVGIRRRIRLKASTDDIGAGCFGIFHPVVILSESATKMHENELRMILLHELVHVKRFDSLVLRLSTLLCLIHWPNPLVWFVLSRLQRERELACDAAVLHILGQKKQKEYGLAILAFAELFPCREPLPGLVGIFEKNGTAKRIDMIIKYKRSKWVHAALGLLLITLVAAIGLSKATEKEQKAVEDAGNNAETKAPVILLKGVVHDPDRQPVAGAIVDMQSRLVESATTDENGRFQFRFPNRLHSSHPFSAWLPGTDLVAYRQLPEITEGTRELPEIEIVLQKGRRFFGKVVDESGKPVAGAYVGASQQSLTIEPVLSDEQGNFEFYFPKDRTNDVFAFKPGVGFDFVGVEMKNDSALSGLLKQENGPILLKLTKTDPISFHITDRKNNPLKGVQINPWVIRKKDGSSTNISVNMCSRSARKLNLFSATTDAGGNAVIDWIPKGIGLKKEDLKGLRESCMKIEFFAYNMREESKDVYGRGTMYWEPGVTKLFAKLPKLVRIEGSVRLADGTPVPWAALSYGFYSNGNGLGYADAAGNFSFDLNPHEKMCIAVQSDLGAAPTAYEVDAGDGRKPPRVDFVLRKGAKLYGTVLAGPDKKPYPTNITIMELGPKEKHRNLRHIRVDKDGYFETKLPKARYEASTWLPHTADGNTRKSDKKEFEITDETEKRIDFYFEKTDKTEQKTAQWADKPKAGAEQMAEGLNLYMYDISVVTAKKGDEATGLIKTIAEKIPKGSDFSSNRITEILRELQKENKLTVLSRPQVMAVENEPASIMVGSEKDQLLIYLKPRKQGDSILNEITLKKTVTDAKNETKTLQWETLAEMRDDKPLLTSGTLGTDEFVLYVSMRQLKSEEVDRKEEKRPENKVTIKTVDETGKPLGKVDIRVLLRDFKDESRAKTTNENGIMVLRLPESPKELIVSATAPGRVPQVVYWDRDDIIAGIKIPDSVTFTLRKGTTIGGIVVDQGGKPVEGAAVRVLSRPNGYGMPGHMKPADGHILAYGNDKPNAFGGVTARRTDRNGRWTLDNVSEGKFYPVEIEITHPDFQMNDELGRASFTTQNEALVEKLRKGEYRFTMKPGVSVSGTVCDAEGRPVKDALVVPGGDPFYYHNDREKAVRTDAEGKYRFDSLRFGSGTVTVIAKGFAPDMKEAKFENGIKAIDFELKPGKKLEIRIVDADGKPVPDVQVVIGNNPDNWWREGSNIFTEGKSLIPGRTDAAGIYRWDWAPDEPVRFRFLKDGFMSYHSAKPYWFAASDQPHVFTMNRLHVKGTVTAQGAEPPAFTVTAGYLPEEGKGDIGWQDGQSIRYGKDGKFTYVVPFDYEKWKIRIEAEDYRPYVSRTLTANEGEHGVVDLGEIVLERAAAAEKPRLSGRILLPDGKPAAGAKTLLAKERDFLQITPPSLIDDPRDPRRSIVEADDRGNIRIEMPKDDKDYRLYVAHPEGFAQVDKSEAKDGMAVRLEKYGKLEIKIPYDEKPEAYNRFSLQQSVELVLDENHRPLPQKMFGFIHYQGTIAPDASVVIDHVAPGKYSFQKLEQDRMMTYNTTDFNVEIKPGETKQWDLTAPNGVKLTARIRLPDDYEGEFTPDDWNGNQIQVSAAWNVNGTAMTYFGKIRPSEDDPREGVVEIEHVVPGQCFCSVTLYKTGKREPNMPLILTQDSLVGNQSTTAVIPESTDAASKVFDLGTIKTTGPGLGKSAP